MKRKKITIVHDYLRTYGGGERVLEVLHKIWPEAAILTATADYKRLGIFGDRFKKLKIRTSWAQKIPFLVKRPIFYRFLLPLIWSTIKLKKSALVISSSGDNIAKGIITPSEATHICYCHTVPHYLYGLETDWNFLDRVVLKYILFPFYLLLKWYDLETNRKVDIFIASSENIKSRIKKYYNRSSIVIYPPCKIPKKLGPVQKGEFFLVVSRLVKYKNIDLIIKAFNKMNLPLRIIGKGREIDKLKKLAGGTVKFLGEGMDKTLIPNYKSCKALVVAAKDEDFGMAAVEAMGYGKPIIALYSGGYKEIVIENKTGIFFKEMNPESIIEAVKKFSTMNFDSKICFQQAQKFSEDNFSMKMKQLVKSY